jgi:hypothetical protein
MYAFELQSQVSTSNLPNEIKDTLKANLQHLNLESIARSGGVNSSELISHLVPSRLDKAILSHIIKQVPFHDGLTLRVNGDSLLIDWWSQATEGRGLHLLSLAKSSQPKTKPPTANIVEQIYQHVRKELPLWKYQAILGFTSLPISPPFNVEEEDLVAFVASYPEIEGIRFTYSEYEGLVADWSAENKRITL